MPQTAANNPTDAINFAEIIHILHHLPAPDLDASDAAKSVFMETCPELADWAAWLGAWQGRSSPELRRPRLALFAALQPAAPDCTPQTLLRLKTLNDDSSPHRAACLAIDADLRAYELVMENMVADEHSVSHACAYGMMAVESGLSVLVLASLSAGQDITARNIANALETGKDALAILCEAAGSDTAAIIGAILAARLANIPVLLSGAGANAAAKIVANISMSAVAHCRDSAGLIGGSEWPAGCDGILSLSILKAACGGTH